MKLSLSQKQRVIIDYARNNNNKITKKQAVELLGDQYYHNGEKYVGEILCRLVNKRYLDRLKPGLFELATSKYSKKFDLSPQSQMSIF